MQRALSKHKRNEKLRLQAMLQHIQDRWVGRELAAPPRRIRIEGE